MRNQRVWGVVWIVVMLTLTQELQAQRRKNEPKEVPAFVYHRFGDDRYPSTNISKANFESHLKYLAEKGYRSLTVSEAIAYLKEPGPVQKVVCLTVDDGFKSFIENGFPLLRKYGFNATVFVNTASVGLSDYMGWQALDSLNQAGIEIGNHSHEHDLFLNDSSATRLETFAFDLMKSQQLMDSLVNYRPTVYAYPYGEFDEDMKRIVREVGFIAAAIQSSGVMHSGGDFYQLPRFPMSDRYAKLGSFIEKLTMLPIREVKVEPIAKGYRGSPDNPTVIFRFPQSNLNIPGVQCFVQGNRCTKSVRIDREGMVQLTVRSKVKLTSRRSLFTVTVPDKQGKWHWFSYTYVNTSLD